MKTNSQRDGNMWKENGTKSRRESKLLEIFCFRQNIGPREGRGDGNCSWELILDMWHVTCDIYRPWASAPSVAGLVTVISRLTKDGLGTCHQKRTKHRTWSESDMFLLPWWNVILVLNEAKAKVFILHHGFYIKLYKSLLLIFSIQARAFV